MTVQRANTFTVIFSPSTTKSVYRRFTSSARRYVFSTSSPTNASRPDSPQKVPVTFVSVNSKSTYAKSFGGFVPKHCALLSSHCAPMPWCTQERARRPV